MQAKDSGGAAFPRGVGIITNGVGMSLRDYFAAAALQGMFAAGIAESSMPIDVQARRAYAAADAMLTERKRDWV